MICDGKRDGSINRFLLFFFIPSVSDYVSDSNALLPSLRISNRL